MRRPEDMAETSQRDVQQKILTTLGTIAVLLIVVIVLLFLNLQRLSELVDATT